MTKQNFLLQTESQPSSQYQFLALEQISHMHQLGVPLFIQLSLAWGLAGLFWPDRMKPLFEVLMFPWSSSYRTLRINSIAAIALSALLFVSLVSGR